MTDKERLSAAAPVRQPPAAAPRPDESEREKTRKRALIVKVPDIPAGIRPPPKAMVAIDPGKTPEPEPSPIQSVEDLFEDDEEDASRAPRVSIIQEPADEPVRDVLPDAGSSDSSSFFEDDAVLPQPSAGQAAPDSEPSAEKDSDGTGVQSTGEGTTALDRAQWLDLLKWSHHCDALTQDQRLQIVRMGRLIQKGRRLTKRQEEQVAEMIALVQRLGYNIP